LVPYKQLVDAYKPHFSTITFEQIPREHNKAADSMASVGSLIDMPANTQKCEFVIEQLLIPAVDVPVTEIICELVGPNSPWYEDIYEYLKNKTFPPDLSPRMM